MFKEDSSGEKQGCMHSSRCLLVLHQGKVVHREMGGRSPEAACARTGSRNFGLLPHSDCRPAPPTPWTTVYWSIKAFCGGSGCDHM